MQSQAAPLSIEKLKKALEKFNWNEAKAVLTASGQEPCNPKDVAEAIRRAARLVLTHPSKAEQRRNELFAELQDYMARSAPHGTVPPEVANAINTIRVAEAGYRKLLEGLNNTAASKMPPTIHIAAAIARAEEEIAFVAMQMDKAMAEKDGMAINTPPLDEAGIPLDLDGALERCNAFVSMTLKLEAHRNGWTTDDGGIVVPVLPTPAKEDILLVGENLFLCVLWQRWAMTEEQARVMGRTLRFLDDRERLPGTPDKIRAIVVEEGDHYTDAVYRIALERMMDKLTQNFIEIRKTVKSSTFHTETSRNHGVLLPPWSWLSYEELHTVWSMGEILGYDLLNDEERPAGLRLIEWVRGYAALMLLTRDTGTSHLTKTKAGWRHFFSHYGLTESVSEKLLDNLTFRRSSRDLFDHPFLRMSNDHYRLIASAVRHISLPSVLFSAIGHLGVPFAKKGKGFEAKVRGLFEDAGIKTYAFTVKRDGQEYDYDVVVPWDGYLFVFECKNRVIPFGNPEQLHYFDLGIQESLGQLSRLVEGLKRYPDIISSSLPEDAASKTVVPVLLNCYPFSIPGPTRGGFLYDYSALSRFFLNGEIELKAALAQGDIEAHPTGIRLWAGDTPTAEDLVKQLRHPCQFRSMAESLELDRVGFPLPPDWWVLGKMFSRSESKTLRMEWARASKAATPTKVSTLSKKV